MTTTERPTPAGSPGVLRTRLLPPRLPPNSVARPALVTRVHRGFGGRVVALVAGAGYGKTTLLVQALETSPTPWVWLSCDARLRTPEMLIAHVAAGIAEAFPGVASALPPGGAPEDQIAALANELVATIPDDFVLALDDVHALEGPVADALVLLAADLPPNIHLAMTGRRALGSALARSAAGGVTQIGEEELAFSFDEAAALLEDAPGGLAEDEIGVIHDRTEGWVAGLLLATRPGGGGAGARLAGGAHFDYLAEEVLGGLPPDTQRFLLDTSVLERFTPAHAAAVSGRADARDVIRGLVDSHLFIVQAEGGWHRYHHLFHAFLRRHLAEHEPGSLPGLHLRAGHAWEASGDHQEAVRHFLEAGAVEEAAAALEPVAESMVPTPERQTLALWLGRIPEDVWRPRPRIALAGALLAYLAGDGRGAFEAWDDAIGRLVEEGDLERAAGALYRSQQAMLTAGVPPAARVAMAAPYLDRLAAAGPVGAMATMIVAVAHAVGVQPQEAERLMGAALASAGRREQALLEPCAEMARGFYFDYPGGRIDQGLARIDGALARLEPIEVEDSRMLQAFGRGFRTAILVDVGRWHAGLEEARAVVELSASVGMRSAPGLLNLWWRFTSLAGLGDWEGMAALEPEARRVVAAGPGTNVGYRITAGLARLAASIGDTGTARARIDAARAAVHGYGDSYEIPTVLCELVLAAVDVRQDALARDIAEEAVALADRYGLDWFRARASLLSAFVHEGTELGDRRLADALALSARHDLTVLWARRERPRAAALLARAVAEDLPGADTAAALAARAGREVLHDAVVAVAGRPAALVRLADAVDEDTDVDAESMRLLLAEDDPAVAGAAERARAVLERRPRQPIRVETFGGLRLYRAGARVPDTAFTRAKARALLGALACAGGRGAHRDRLLEHLWPDLAPERGARALDTTLHELRRTLEPAASPRSGGSLVVREGELYRLALGERDSWDAAEFRELAGGAAGAADDVALGRMLRAETLWRGDFLPDFPYEPWAEGIRGELEHERVALLERLAVALMDTGRPAAAIERLRRLLDTDPEREGWHRQLMRAYAQAGERALALRQFHACRATLRGRLGIEPSAETRELYASLL
ncbi:MAG TPA: BTAD domain-containing putative transcriptional regulator [Miltoncostaeaceae bacterium]|nr:BTAD domain-containing putative transcriptional regulator [Miltoncostaeaceae bacterium]